MGKHYEISGNELKILSKYVQNYANAPFKSFERINIVNLALRDLTNEGFKRWDHKKVTIYFNNNKKNFENQSKPQTPANQQLHYTTPMQAQMHFMHHFSSMEAQINPIKNIIQQSLSLTTPNYDQANLTTQAQLNRFQAGEYFPPIPNLFLNNPQHSSAPLTKPKLIISQIQKVNEEDERTNQIKIIKTNTSGSDGAFYSQAISFDEDQSKAIEEIFDSDDENRFNVISLARNSSNIDNNSSTSANENQSQIIDEGSFKNCEENQLKIIDSTNKSSSSDISKTTIQHTYSFNEDQTKDNILIPSNKTQRSYSSSLDSPSSKSVSFDTQEEQYSEQSEPNSQIEIFMPRNLEDLLKQLDKVRINLVGDAINQKEYDCLKYDMNQSLQNTININHMSAFCELNTSERLQFQIKLEAKTVRILKELVKLLKSSDIYSHDPNIKQINAPSIYRIVSLTTRQYNNEEISPVNSRPNSQILSSEVDMNPLNEADLIDLSDEELIKIKYLNGLTIKPYKNHHLQDEKLERFYNGKIYKERIGFQKFEKTNASTIISYHIGDSNSDNAVCEVAYVDYNYSSKSYVLHFNSKNVEISSLKKVVTMHFHRHENVNKIYICDQNAVIEFTIIGFDEFILNENQDFEIKETNSFQFENDSNLQSAVITIWDDELVLGAGANLYFWKIGSRLPLVTINEKKLGNITSLCAIESESADESSLAVSSSSYPVIYVYNKNHENISRLVSHTMGVTSLKCIGKSLFSGSLDMNVRIWDINKGIPELSFNTHCVKIKLIEFGAYLDNLFLFVADENEIQCFDITNQKFVFIIPLFGYVKPKEMVLLTGKNNDSSDFAKLVVLMEFFREANTKSLKISDVLLTIEFM